MKTVKFYTLGCKVNQYDTQGMRERFVQVGFKELEDTHPADIYIINTCTVTHKADADSLNVIRRAKRENPRAKVIVTGCLTELDAGRIRNTDCTAIIVKNKDKEKILNYFNNTNSHELSRPSINSMAGSRLNVDNWRDTQIFTNFIRVNSIKIRVDSCLKGISYFKGHTRAFLKIQDGCDNFCSYCKVPYVRGLSRSKPPDEIIKEAGALLKNGFKELVLCGICLGSYGKDLKQKITLVNVIDALQNLDGIFRLRLSSIEAGDISDELIEKIAHSQKLCRHLHIPIQSGDDEILKKMGRRYCCLDYQRLIQKIKNRIPEIAITTDVLVGFPTETGENFQNTVKLIKEIVPLKVHVFPYSHRQGTQAAIRFDKDVGPKIIKERSVYLKEVASCCSLDFKRQFLNRGIPVLVEGKSKLRPGFWEGHTDNYLKVLFRSNRKLKNTFVLVRLKKIVNDYFLADLLDNSLNPLPFCNGSGIIRGKGIL